MGAWGTGAFENDNAMDWLHHLEESKGTELLQQVFEKIENSVRSGEHLETRDGEVGQAAGEVVAAMLNRPGTELARRATAWIASGRATADANLVALAANAVQHVLNYEDSELKQLWERMDNEDAASWKARMKDLLQRLRAS
jgi:hypothetical protein